MNKSKGSIPSPNKSKTTSAAGNANVNSGKPQGGGGSKPPAPAGKPATGKPAATGTTVTDLNRDYRSQSDTNRMELDYTRQQNDASADFLERMERNIYGPKQQRELAQDERKNDRNAKSQEKVAATQAAASQYGSKQSADASKYGSKQSTEAQKFAAAEGTKQAEIQARAQMFAANVDAAARRFDTKTKGRTEFSGLLANLAAAVGNKSADNTAALLSTAGQVSAAASQGKNADADRMADIYKSIMQTYNTGSGQFRYW